MYVENQQEIVPLPQELHGVVIGVNGRSVQKIEMESGAQVYHSSYMQ